MDDMKRRFVYDEVLLATREDRRKILDMWVEFGESASKSEDKELGKELLRLKRKSAHASALAKSVLASADDRTEFIAMLDKADSEGLKVVGTSEDEDDEDEEEA